MSKYVIKGGSPLEGDVKVSGAKNATLGILAASILTDEDILVENIPDVRDVNIMIESIKELGCTVERVRRDACRINASTISKFSLSDNELSKMRATYYFVGSLLGRFKEAKVLHPGGCNIGARPIDLHLKGFKALGADAYEEGGYIVAKADALQGAHIYLDVVSVGATINIMLASVLASGTTIIENVAKEPHVVDLANFLNSMGASVRGAGTDIIRIKGVKKLHGTNYTVISDQIEAGTFMALAAATRGHITVKNVIPKHLESITAKIIDMGCEVYTYDEAVRVLAKTDIHSATSIKTMPYPGFPTDMQPQFAAALGLNDGKSTIIESIFENRFMYVEELKKFGAKATVEGQTLILDGVKKYNAANVKAPDLRAGAALVIAALAADGISIVDNIEYVERGYEDLEYKLTELGAKIKKINSEEELRFFIQENE